jgi:serine/threonine protein kinase
VLKKVAKYKIIRALENGEGAFGKTYLAEDTVTGEHVALKMIKNTQMALDDFRNEAKALMCFNHPNIIRYKDCNYFEVGPNERIFYLATEFAESGTLKGKIGDVSTMMAVDYGSQMLTGLAECHRQQRIHSDLKPDNIFLTRNRAKIGDFGISVDSTKTIEGRARGTPSYMAPEQFPPTLRLSKRTDLWSAGVVLFELVYGHHPFPTLQEILNTNVEAHCPPISQFPGLGDVIRRALTKSERFRYQTAEEFLDALQQCCRTIIKNVMKAEQGIVGWENDGQGHADRSFLVEFRSEFKSDPIVHAAVELMDISTDDRSSRLRVEVRDISNKSARIQVSCWDVSRIWGCKIRWLALGE